MTSRRRSEALLKDIAQLFVTYRSADWAPLLAELRGGGELQRRIARAIEDVEAERGRAKRTARKPKTKPRPVRQAWKNPERATKLDKLEAGLRSRKLLSDPKALRELLARTGSKDTPPSARASAIRTLLERLDEMPAKRFASLVDAIEQSGNIDVGDFDGDYARWFTLIIGPPSGTDPLVEIHDRILTLMDRAMVRGASQFARNDESKLLMEKKRWSEADGVALGGEIVDEFLSIVRMARGQSSREQERFDVKIYQLKQRWRELAPRSSQAESGD